MSRKTLRIVILCAVLGLLAAVTPTSSAVAANTRVKTVSKVGVAIQRQGGFVAIAAGGGSIGSDTVLDDDLVKVQVKVSSKKFDTVDQLSITYYCAHASGDPDLAKSNSKWIAPEGGIALPKTISLTLPKDRDSSLCYISAGLSAPWNGERNGKVTLALKTVKKK